MSVPGARAGSVPWTLHSEFSSGKTQQPVQVCPGVAQRTKNLPNIGLREWIVGHSYKARGYE